MKNIVKKLFLVIVVSMLAIGANAQKWSVGGRVGSGIQAVGMYDYSDKCYIEARFGMSYTNARFDHYWWGVDYTLPLSADFTVLHNWNVLEFDWTPGFGKWSFDAGVGLNVGGGANWAYVGVAGLARLDFTFDKLPLTIGLDWTPKFGPSITYGVYNKPLCGFNAMGLSDFGVTCTYRF